MSESAGSFLSALLDPDAYYPIFIRLCEVLSIAEIIALTRTCKKFQNLYQTLLPLQWNVDRTLQRFVTDPRRFRQEMGKHDALISGGTVLQYFERVVWKESDLDIYVQDGPKAEAMAHYVSTTDSYKLVETKHADDYPSPRLKEVQTYTRRNQSKGADSHIQIIKTNRFPVVDIIECFHSTIVVNFFTHNKAYSLFPKPTFLSHRAYRLGERSQEDFASPAKYSERGWTFREAKDPLEMDPYRPITGTTRIGDSATWIIPFDSVKPEASAPDYVLELSEFNCRTYWYWKDPGPEAYNFSAEMLLSIWPLRYQYLFSRRNGWSRFLKRALFLKAITEFENFDPPIRLPTFAFHDFIDLGSLASPRQFGQELPDDFVYWDNEIPKLWEEYQQRKPQKVVRLKQSRLCFRRKDNECEAPLMLRFQRELPAIRVTSTRHQKLKPAIEVDLMDSVFNKWVDGEKNSFLDCAD